MAEFKLNIYGKDDEIIKSFETDKIRWGVYLQALELSEGIQDKKPAEQFKQINNFIKKIFPELTDEDLEMADADDVMNTFTQLLHKANKIGGGENSKNSKRTGTKK